jgi:hypothetical protein
MWPEKKKKKSYTLWYAKGVKENYAIIFCFNANLANEIFIFMNIIGNILGVAIESYDDHYLGLHSKLLKTS